MTLADYIAELKAEAHSRAEAYLPALTEQRVCGIVIEPMPFSRLTLLDLLGNAFVTGGRFPEAADIAQFFWVLSPHFSPEKTIASRWHRWRLMRKIRSINFIDAVEEITNFVEAMTIDIPSGDPVGVPYISAPAQIIHVLSTAYGWSWREIMDLPMPVISQQVRAIAKASDPKQIMFNSRSDRAKMKLLKEMEK